MFVGRNVKKLLVLIFYNFICSSISVKIVTDLFGGYWQSDSSLCEKGKDTTQQKKYWEITITKSPIILHFKLVV